mgnify:CR=1 FL=1
MSLGPTSIRYTLKTGGTPLVWEVDWSEEAKFDDFEDLPHWTRLDYSQCECCPLKAEEHPYCPAAVRAHEVLSTFRKARSFDQVTVEVESSQRQYRKTLPLQEALQSLLGLLMATSGCPVLGRFRPLASFHMPFSSFEETLFRTVGAYLIHQYFEARSGGDPDWNLDGLKDFYHILEDLNRDFSQRIKAVEENDAISNALVIFFSTSAVVADSIEDGLVEYQNLFTATPPDSGKSS